MDSLGQHIINFTIFGILLTSFGFALGGAPLQSQFNSIFAPPPAFNSLMQQSKTCGAWDIGCNGQNVAIATANVAAALWYPAILLFTALSRITQFSGLMIGVLQLPFIGTATIPFLPLFVAGIFLGMGVEIFRLFRGNSSGSTL